MQHFHDTLKQEKTEGPLSYNINATLTTLRSNISYEHHDERKSNSTYHYNKVQAFDADSFVVFSFFINKTNLNRFGLRHTKTCEQKYLECLLVKFLQWFFCTLEGRKRKNWQSKCVAYL